MQFRDFAWDEIVFDLKRLGMDHVQIVGALNGCVTERALRKYMAGSQPSHWRGEMLLTLWVVRTGKTREQAPVRAAPVRIQAGSH
jgi:hypothetical protein